MAIDFSKQFSPHRGSHTTMTTTKKSTVLAAGEIFFEYPDEGIGSGACKVKMGDGVTTYENLAYAIENDASGAQIYFDPNTEETVADALDDVTSGSTNAVLVAALKQAVTLLNGEVVKAIAIDGIAGELDEYGGMTFTTPDYAVSAVTAATGANVVLTPSTGYGKTSSAVGFTSTDSSIALTVTGGLIDIEANPTGAISGLYASDFATADKEKVLVSTSAGKVGASTVSVTALNYVGGVTADVQTQIDGKAPSVHTHDGSDITGNIAVTKLVAGTSGEKIPLALIPDAAIERVVTVETDETTTGKSARQDLTSDDVQLGDVVHVEDTNLMYFVTDVSKLGTADWEDAYTEFTAGIASSVEWANVQNKPASVTAAFVGATTVAGTMGLVPAPGTADVDKYLAGDGTWTALPGAFVGATTAAAGEIGFVPAPATSDTDKWLNSNGSWTPLPAATSAVAGTMSAEDFNAVAMVKAGIYDFGDEE